MIGSHNSMTYLQPRYWIFRPFAFLWRTQTKNLKEQIKEGVDYVDIRVRRDSKFNWRLCHSIVDLQAKSKTITGLMQYIHHDLGIKKSRLLLERGFWIDEEAFKTAVNFYLAFSPYAKNVTFVAIKKGWQVIKDADPPLIDYSYVPFKSNKGFWWNLAHLKLSTITKWARKHNPRITNKIKQSDTVHFMDMI